MSRPRASSTRHGLGLGLASALASVIASAGVACRGGPPAATEPRTIAIAPAPPSSASSLADRAPDPHASSPWRAAPTLAIGASELCLRTAGRVHCTRDLDPDASLTASTPVPGLDDVVDLAHGSAFACAVVKSGGVSCWGHNDQGQLGTGSAELDVAAPAPVLGVSDARRVFAGDAHACALLADGRLTCWGQNDRGQTGSATRHLPTARMLVRATPVDGVRDVTHVAMGRWTTCALASTRSGFCWGAPLFTTGSKYDVNDRPPGLAPALERYEDVGASNALVCGVRDGEITCFGGLSPLFDYRSGAREEKVEGIRNAKLVRVASHYACALLADGFVSCWGMNYGGTLGRPSTDTRYQRQPPTRIPDVTNAVELAVGERVACAVGADKRVLCWGTFPSSKPAATAKEMPPTPVTR
ncbi:MAG: hypothetical protein JST00_25195 [Deltaproteobacteria bacterium]|nr:hypothetical protein [Deltaproteobacteria bacterium]